MPLALNNLETEPFIEGDFYEGDLLVNVLTCECFFWKSHPEYLDRMDKLIKLVIDEIEEVDLLQDIKRLILDRISEYRNCVS
jgi:hypothetical protein